MTTPEPTPEAVEALAAVVDPPAFAPAVPKSMREVAKLQWAARRLRATTAARAVLAAGYVLPEWKPGRWYRAIGPEGDLWCESSDRAEVVDLAREGDRLERIWHTTMTDEWRALDSESGS